ncbi:MAG: hypothetical protein JSS09_02150 [Verrucomicrobia bacterium]|nr:hypothetical protein [Verrucomicrobiota bacterium]
MEGEYKRNPYILGVDNRLKSAKSLDKEKLHTHEKGNVIFCADGTKKWEPDKKNGQYFKKKGAPVEEAEKDERPMYSTLSCEQYLNKGESEWCGSYSIRMLHSAYLQECMPEFPLVLKELETQFKQISGYKEGDPFEKKQAKLLYLLAEKYSETILSSSVGSKYFRDMNPTVRISPRCTPDMIYEFLLGEAPGPVSCLKRSWQVLTLPTSRDHNEQSTSFVASFWAGQGLVGVLGIPTAVLKLGYNVTAATTGLIPDLALATYEGYEKSIGQSAREEEAGITRKYTTAKAVKDGGVAFIVNGIGKRVFWDYSGASSLYRKATSFKPEIPAF